jgi:hypothetical protein
MKNITISVPDEIYLEARVKAAQLGTSVSALVKTFLESLPGSDCFSPSIPGKQGPLPPYFL